MPTLLVGDRPLTEVAAILFYLARRFPEAGLLPVRDCETEAHILSWMSFLAATLHPARRQGLDHARKIYALADRRLGDRNWAIGSYSIADIHLFRLFWRFRNSFPETANEMPGLSRHHDRMMERPAVRRTCEIEAAIGYELPA